MTNTAPPRPEMKKHPLARATHLGMCLMSLLFFSGCESQALLPQVAKSPAVPQTTTALAAEVELQNRIVAEIGSATCSNHAQCRTVALGAKACGGPQAWSAWSTAVSNEATLSTLSEQLALLQRRRHAQSGMASTCQFVADPGALCQAQRCALRLPDTAQ